MLLKDREKRFKASFDEGFFSVFDDWGDLMDWNEKQKSLIDQLNELMELNYKKALKKDWDDIFMDLNRAVKRVSCCMQDKIEKSKSEAA